MNDEKSISLEEIGQAIGKVLFDLHLQAYFNQKQLIEMKKNMKEKSSSPD